MQSPEEQLLSIIKDEGVDLLCSLPCDRVKGLINLLGTDEDIKHLPLTREEDGVGICAGAALAGRKSAMLLQSSGIGNMVNALLSLTDFYSLPLVMFLSHRGIYKEGIEAQVPMGVALPAIIESLGINYTVINSAEQFDTVKTEMAAAYANNKIHAFLLSPEIWDDSCLAMPLSEGAWCQIKPSATLARDKFCAEISRFDAIKVLAETLKDNAVVANLGIPSKELYSIVHQASNFYMLGSMGLVTAIGHGVALYTDKRVFVIDGDGSLLMNPGTLATVAYTAQKNLTILAIDNGAYGSTGSQPTLTGHCADLAVIAQGMGIKNTMRASTPDEIKNAVTANTDGPLFVHIPVLTGNAKVDNIPLSENEIRDGFMEFLRG